MQLAPLFAKFPCSRDSEGTFCGFRVE